MSYSQVVIQKFVKIGRSAGLPVPPHPNVAFIETHGKYTCDQGHQNDYSTICKLSENLESFLRRHGDESTMKIALLQTAHALNHIHENGWVHGEIKLDYIYLSKCKEKVQVILQHPRKVADNAGELTRKQANDIKDLQLVFEQVMKMRNEAVTEVNESAVEKDLLKMMKHRSTTCKKILQHPYFWDAERKLNFLSKITQFSKAGDVGKPTKDALNGKSEEVFGKDWLDKLSIKDPKEKDEYNHKLHQKNKKKSIGIDVIKKLAQPKTQKKEREERTQTTGINCGEQQVEKTKKSQYQYDNLQSLLNFIRNRWEHFWEDSQEVQACFLYDHGAGFWKFFSRRFKDLFVVVYSVAKEQSENWSDSGINDIYFENIAENKQLPKLNSEEDRMAVD